MTNSSTPAAQDRDEHRLAALRHHVDRASAGSVIGVDFAIEHVAMVERFVRRLAPRLGARLDVVLPAAILHDIAAIEDFANVDRHHELGALRAVELLRDHHFPDELFAPVAQCVQRHLRPVATGAGPAEVVCLSHADALSQMANPAYFLHYAHTVRGLPFRDARSWYLALVHDRWRHIDPVLRDSARPHYLRALGACADDRSDSPVVD